MNAWADINAMETIQLDRLEDGIVVVTLNRPDVANAINTQMGRELEALFNGFSASPTPPRAIVLTAAGERHFCSGGDLKERNGMTDDAFLAQHAIYERAFMAIMECPVPVIAAINGVAFAGGCELALSCDFIFAASHARFALTETSIGIMPGCGGTQNLPRAVGLRRAKQILLSALPFSVTDAERWGMVNEICEPAELMPKAIAIAQRIAGNAPLAVRQAKKSMHHGSRMDSRTALFFEVEAYNRLVSTEDRMEGIAAFNEKRKPRFQGR